MREKSNKLPIYLKSIYGWLYSDWKKSKFFDRPRFLSFITLGYRNKLVESCAKEISTSNKVLQFGATFGDQIDVIAEKVGIYGHYDIADISEVQLQRCEEKYKYAYSQLQFLRHDISQKFSDKYDVVICFNILHELPILTKTKVINNALSCLNEKGKVVFIDYANPSSLHPLRYFVRMFNRLYQPFAEKLWDREIHTFADNKTEYTWRKSVFFGGMYQKVIAEKKEKII